VSTESLPARRARPTAGSPPRARLPGGASRILLPLLFAIVVVGAWEIYVVATHTRQIILPAPTAVASALWGDRATLASDGLTTIEEIVLGFLLAAALGVALAVLVHSSRVAERALYPWLVVSQMVPIPAIAPIFVIWTGFDIRPKLMVVALVCFFPIAVNTIDGLRAVDPELISLLRTMGASRFQRFRIARLPAALPFVFSGLKVSAAFSVLGAVFGEWVGSSSGLGYEILIYNNQEATADMFAVIVVLSAIGIALFTIVTAAEQITLPWYHAARGRPTPTVARLRRRRSVRP
jgi:putative hydroxymethylpyrimidine transport system permease protein